jgi:hypothetical protein
MNFFFKVILSSVVIAFVTWLAGRKPALAGFLIALPLSSMIAIAMVQAEWGNPEKSAEFARSILVSIPLSLTFFLPFLFAKQIKLPFWGTYVAGIILLACSYGIHTILFKE